MKVKQIVFSSVNQAQLQERETPPMNADSVLVRMDVTTISNGTERANLTGNLNVGWNSPPPKEATFPRYTGYSGAGVVCAVGEHVTQFQVGDRVATSWGFHADHWVFPPSNLTLIPDGVTEEEAAIAHISTFPLAAVRKTGVEIGESAIVMGQGILGLHAVQFFRIAGAYPVIAADPIPERREQALRFGADYALDPMAEGFAQRVKELTGGKGVRAAIEVTGKGQALDQVLDCMAPLGRVALLGCTRDSNFTIDYYRKVHGPGITLIGAHTNARPKVESYPHYWTHHEDKQAAMALLKGGRIHWRDMIAETHRPEECSQVYHRLAYDRDFPVCVQFRWR